jgi:D-alanyl-D-alanine carboxypeptidase
MVKTMPLDADGKHKQQKTAQANLFALPFSNFSTANAVPMQMTPGPVIDNAPVQAAEANALQPASSALGFASTQQQPAAAVQTPAPENKPQVLAENPQAPAHSAPRQLSETEELELEARALAAVKAEVKADTTPTPAPAALAIQRKHQVASTNSIPVSAPAPATEPDDAIPAAAKSGWSIQIGAYPDAKQARERLDEAQDAAKALLAKASPYTEKVSKGPANLFRARFAGFHNEHLARRACQTLQRSQFDCIVAKN